MFVDGWGVSGVCNNKKYEVVNNFDFILFIFYEFVSVIRLLLSK